jgi:hypothetical protein
MRYGFLALAGFTAFGASFTQAHAMSGSPSYMRAVNCAANAHFLEGWLNDKVGQEVLIGTTTNSMEGWLGIARAKGEKSYPETLQDWSLLSDQIRQGYFQSMWPARA